VIGTKNLIGASLLLVLLILVLLPLILLLILVLLILVLLILVLLILVLLPLVLLLILVHMTRQLLRGGGADMFLKSLMILSGCLEFVAMMSSFTLRL